MKNVLHLSLASFATIFSINHSIAKDIKPSDCLHDLDKLSCVRYVSNYDGDSFVFNVLDIHPIFGEKVRFELVDVQLCELLQQHGLLRLRVGIRRLYCVHGGEVV